MSNLRDKEKTLVEVVAALTQLREEFQKREAHLLGWYDELCIQISELKETE